MDKWWMLTDEDLEEIFFQLSARFDSLSEDSGNDKEMANLQQIKAKVARSMERNQV
jgi:hypothetical protein